MRNYRFLYWNLSGNKSFIYKGIVMVDMVNRPPHYLVGGIEAIDVIKSRLTKEEYIGYLKGCKLKYDLRYPFKDNPQQDLEKSDWYKNKLLEATKDEDAVNPPEVEAILERFDDE
jgi:hypothetical protein